MQIFFLLVRTAPQTPWQNGHRQIVYGRGVCSTAFKNKMTGNIQKGYFRSEIWVQMGFLGVICHKIKIELPF